MSLPLHLHHSSASASPSSSSSSSSSSSRFHKVPLFFFANIRTHYPFIRSQSKNNSDNTMKLFSSSTSTTSLNSSTHSTSSANSSSRRLSMRMPSFGLSPMKKKRPVLDTAPSFSENTLSPSSCAGNNYHDDEEEEDISTFCGNASLWPSSIHTSQTTRTTSDSSSSSSLMTLPLLDGEKKVRFAKVNQMYDDRDVNEATNSRQDERDDDDESSAPSSRRWYTASEIARFKSEHQTFGRLLPYQPTYHGWAKSLQTLHAQVSTCTNSAQIQTLLAATDTPHVSAVTIGLEKWVLIKSTAIAGSTPSVRTIMSNNHSPHSSSSLSHSKVLSPMQRRCELYAKVQRFQDKHHERIHRLKQHQLLQQQRQRELGDEVDDDDADEPEQDASDRNTDNNNNNNNDCFQEQRDILADRLRKASLALSRPSRYMALNCGQQLAKSMKQQEQQQQQQ